MARSSRCSCSHGTVTALPVFKASIRRATSSSHASCTDLSVAPRLSSNVFAKAARSSTGSSSARFKRSETSGLIASFSYHQCATTTRRGAPFLARPLREKLGFSIHLLNPPRKLFHSTNRISCDNQPLLRNSKSTKSDHARRSNQRVRDHPRDERPENRRQLLIPQDFTRNSFRLKILPGPHRSETRKSFRTRILTPCPQKKCDTSPYSQPEPADRVWAPTGSEQPKAGSPTEV